MALEDVERFRKAKTRAAVLYAVAALLGLTAYACAVTALVIWVARHADPVVAAGVAAAGFAALALVILAVVALQNRAERRHRAERADAYSATLRSAAGSALTGARVGPQALAAGVAFLVAGLAFGMLKGSRSARRGADQAPHSERG